MDDSVETVSSDDNVPGSGDSPRSADPGSAGDDAPSADPGSAGDDAPLADRVLVPSADSQTIQFGTDVGDGLVQATGQPGKMAVYGSVMMAADMTINQNKHKTVNHHHHHHYYTLVNHAPKIETPSTVEDFWSDFKTTRRPSTVVHTEQTDTQAESSPKSEMFTPAVTLMDTNGMIIITGGQREDRSRLGRDLLKHFGKQGFAQKVVHKKEEWTSHADRLTDPDTLRVQLSCTFRKFEIVLLEDILGEESVDKTSLKEWSDVLVNPVDTVEFHSLLVITVASSVIKQVEEEEGMRFPIPVLDIDKYDSSRQRTEARDKNRPQNLGYDSPTNLTKETEFEAPPRETRKKAIHAACRQGNIEIVSLLLGLPAAELTQYMVDGELDLDLIFHKAVTSGNTELLLKLLEHGVDPETRDRKGRTALHLAIDNDRVDVAKLLISHSHSTDATNMAGWTPLHCACARGNVAMVKFLIDTAGTKSVSDTLGNQPIDIDTRTLETSRTALHIASEGNNVDVLTVLIEKGAAVGAVDNTKCTPLHLSSFRGKTEAAEVLLRNKADVNATDKERRTATHMAALNNHTSTLQLLIGHGADLNLRDIHGQTALHLACSENHAASARLLLEHNADAMLTDNDKNTPLHLACSKGGSDLVFSLLFKHTKLDIRKREPTSADHPVLTVCQRGISIFVMNNDGNFPLHMACQAGNLISVWHLLAQSSSVSMKNKDGDTALHVASRKGQDVVVRSLLKHITFDPNMVEERNRGGWTPLHCASYHGNDEAVKPLIAAEARVDTKDLQGRNPLCLACQQGHESTVDILLQADTSNSSVLNIAKTTSLIKTTTAAVLYEDTALHAACRDGLYSMVKKLLEAKRDPNSRPVGMFSPLDLASMHGHARIVELLLKYQASVDSPGPEPTSFASQGGPFSWMNTILQGIELGLSELEPRNLAAIHWASVFGQDEVVAVLLRHRVDPNSSTGTSEITPLYFASCYGHLKTAEILLDNGADPNSVANGGSTPLYCAALCGYNNLLKLLLKAGACAGTIESQSGVTALSIACARSHAEVVETLVRNGSNVNDSRGFPLHCASWAGQSDIVEILLRHGADLEIVTPRGDTPLITAVRQGNSGVVKTLIQNGADTNKTDAGGNTALHIAADKSHVEILRILLDDKQSLVNAKTVQGLTPLHLACHKGHGQVTDILIDRKADVGAKSRAGHTPLHAASEAGNAQVACSLLAAGADLEAKDNIGWTALLFASSEGHEKFVETLVKKGCNLHSSDARKWSALHFACQFGFPQVVNVLLRNGAIRDAQTSEEFTPLHIASYNGHEDIVNILLASDFPTCEGTVKHKTSKESGIPFPVQNVTASITENVKPTTDFVNARAMRGLTALYLASQMGWKTVVDILLKNNADVALATFLGGSTPLMMASVQGHSDIVKTLIDNGADVNSQDWEGFTAFLLASWYGKKNVLDILIKHKVDSGLKTSLGLNALHLASARGHKEIVEWLLQRGFSVQDTDSSGRVPVHIASFYGQAEIVSFLRKQGSATNQSDSLGWTALHAACCNGHADVVRILIADTPCPETKKGGIPTPLQLACGNGHADVAQILLDKCAVRPDHDDCGTLLRLACAGKYFKVPQTSLQRYCVGNHAELVSSLIKRGFSVNACDRNGNSVLHLASAAGLADVASLLVESGASVKWRNSEGDTALHLASSAGCADVVRLLIKHGVDVTSKNDDGETALHFACYHGHEKTALELLRRGARPNAASEDGNTSLHYACAGNRAGIVRLLLRNKAVADCQNLAGLTPMDYAEFEKSQETVQLLRESRAKNRQKKC